MLYVYVVLLLIQRLFSCCDQITICNVNTATRCVLCDMKVTTAWCGSEKMPQIRLCYSTWHYYDLEDRLLQR